jgi:HSP20 family protein
MDIKNLTSRAKKKEPAGQEQERENPLLSLQREMNRIVESFFPGLQSRPFGELPGMFSPHMNVAETDKAVQVTIELPGMDDKDVEVALTQDTLTIRGVKREEKSDQTRSYHRFERTFGSFNRTISLPADLDHDKVSATFKKGILTISLPKSTQALQEAKKIPVTTG